MKKLSLTFYALLFVSTHVVAQPVITVQPTNQAVVWGGNATFSVNATGVGPLTYRWQLNGTNLPNNIITTVAGGGGGIGDDGLASIASLNAPQSVAVDAVGNVFIADTGNQCIRKIGLDGIIIRFAGTGTAGYSGDNGSAKNAQLNNPSTVVLDTAGNLFIADESNGRIRKVTTNGIITTVMAGLINPTGVAVDPAGNVFIAEQNKHRVLKIDTNSAVTTVAGIGSSGYTGDGDLATNANLSSPTGVAVDATGDLFIADYANNVIRKVDTNGIITTVAGNGTTTWRGDGYAATNNGLVYAPSVWADNKGNLFIADRGFNFILKVDTNGIAARAAGSGFIGSVGDGGAATNAALTSPFGAVTDAAGNLFIADTGNHRIRKVDTNGIITSIAGNGTTTYMGDGVMATTARLGSPTGVAADAAGNIYIADRSFHLIRKVDANQIITMIAGNGIGGYNGNGPALLSRMNNPNGVAVNNLGIVFVADQANNRVRKILANGFFGGVAGTGTASFSGDGGGATLANVNAPAGVAMDALGNVFIADQSNQRVRKVDTNGIITTVAGNGTATYSGDGGAATNASLNNPAGIAVDAIGNIFIADRDNSRIRRVNTNGVITTFAGTNAAGYSGEGMAITNRLKNPTGVAVDPAGNVFIADQNNNRIRQVGTNGIMTTIAGTGFPAFNGDGIAATNAYLFSPADVEIDIAGSLLIADQSNFRIRKVTYSNKPYLTLMNVNPNNASNYSVIVTSASGSVTSSVVSLNLLLPPIVPTFTANTGTFTLTWNAVSNLTYQLQWATNLVTPNWQNLGTPITATNHTVSASDIPGSDAQRFYRAVWLQ